MLVAPTSVYSPVFQLPCFFSLLTYTFLITFDHVLAIFLDLTLGRRRKLIPPPLWYKGGLMEPLPRVFDMLKYFDTILPSV